MSLRPHTVTVPVKTDPRVPGEPRSREAINIAGLHRDLRDAVEGEVRFDAGTKAMYAHDGSNYRQVPIGVVIPRTGQGSAVRRRGRGRRRDQGLRGKLAEVKEHLPGIRGDD